MRKDTFRSENPLLDSILTSPYTTGFIRKKVRQLIGRAGFTRSDVESLKQELYLKLLKHFPAFDPEQSHPNAFITTILERFIANLLRDRRAEKRDHRLICSLNVTIGCEDGRQVEISETVTDREDNARRCRTSRSPQDEAELRMDVAELLGKLADESRNVCQRLMAGDSVSQIARDIGIPRTTLQDRIRKLRDRFEEDGLKDYL